MEKLFGLSPTLVLHDSSQTPDSRSGCGMWTIGFREWNRLRMGDGIPVSTEEERLALSDGTVIVDKPDSCAS